MAKLTRSGVALMSAGLSWKPLTRSLSSVSPRKKSRKNEAFFGTMEPERFPEYWRNWKAGRFSL